MKNRLLVIVSALVAMGLSAQTAEAQRRGGFERGDRQMQSARAFRGGPGVEGILRQRANLELTDSQIESLNQLRLEALEERSALRAQAARIRSDAAVGELESTEVRDAMHELRGEQYEAADRIRGSVEGILTDEQQEKLSEQRMQRRGRTGIGSRRGFDRRRDGAQRGGRGFRRGGGDL